MEPLTTSGTNLRTAFVLLLVAAVTALFLAVVWPFLKPLLLAALLAGLFHRFYRWVTRLLGGRQSLGAAVTLLVLLVLGLGPTMSKRRAEPLGSLFPSERAVYQPVP